MSHLHFFMKKQVSSSQNFAKQYHQIEYGQNGGTLTRYCKVLDYLLEKYVTNYCTVKMGGKMFHFTTPSNMASMEHAEALWNKALRYGRVYNEYVLNGLFIGGPHGFIRHGIRSYRISKKNDIGHDVARHVTSLTRLQYGLVSSNKCHTTNKPKFGVKT